MCMWDGRDQAQVTAPQPQRHSGLMEGWLSSPHPTTAQPSSPEHPSGWHPHSPLVLNVLVDHASDEHGDQGVVPGGDKHQGQAEAHAQEGQCPGPEMEEGPESGKDLPDSHQQKLLRRKFKPHPEWFPTTWLRGPAGTYQ